MNDPVKEQHAGQAAPAGSDTLQAAALYDRFVERVRQIFDKGQEKGREAWEKSMALAHEQLAAAGEFSAGQGEVYQRYLRRDLDQTLADMRHLGEEAKERLNPARLGAGALASLASALQAAGGALSALSAKVDEALIYKTGEITTAGTLTCMSCGKQAHLRATGVVPPCAACHGTRFRKGY